MEVNCQNPVQQVTMVLVQIRVVVLKAKQKPVKQWLPIIKHNVEKQVLLKLRQQIVEGKKQSMEHVRLNQELNVVRLVVVVPKPAPKQENMYQLLMAKHVHLLMEHQQQKIVT